MYQSITQNIQIINLYVCLLLIKINWVLEHLWQVEIDKHDLECSQNLTGPYRVALSSKALTLIKMSPSNASNAFECFEFPVSYFFFF